MPHWRSESSRIKAVPKFCHGVTLRVTQRMREIPLFGRMQGPVVLTVCELLPEYSPDYDVHFPWAFANWQINVVWLDVVTYLHHHGYDEKVPWYRGEVRPRIKSLKPRWVQCNTHPGGQAPTLAALKRTEAPGLLDG